MDSSFWNKLKKTIMTAPKAQPSSAMQLSRFNKCWTTVQSGFSTPEKRSLHIQQTEIPMRLKNMVDLLVDEESRLDDVTGTTGVCMEYLLKNDVLGKLVNNSEADQPRGIVGETIRTIAGMINLLDDRFLVHNAVHKPTVKLLRTCASGSEPQGESYHEDLVDLMYILCSKIHGYPELLNIFFHDRQWLTVPQRAAANRLQKNKETMELLKKQLGGATDNDASMDNTEQQTQDAPFSPKSTSTEGSPDSPGTSKASTKTDYEFLLFTYLSKFVHLEGKAGDFARTGLLFLMELATGSLGEYILDSEFTSLVSAGVGALYSQLPRKLLVRGGPSTINSMVGTLNDRAPPEATPSRRANIELSTSTDFQSRLDAFLKLLEFCQDVMMRCPNSEIVAALLVTFKTVFLENILYPSILECSDTDGSSVAVISYIDLILQVLEHEALVDLVVGFLMASDEDETSVKAPAEEGDAFAEVQNPQTTSPYFMATGRFTLKDLVLSRLKSRSQPTVIATLKLLNTVITRHCKYSLKLLSIQPDDKATSFRGVPDFSQDLRGEGDLTMINHHVHELDLFYALISTINPLNTAEIFCNGYESYLRDAEGSVETHQCFLRGKESASQATPGQLSVLERKKQRRRSMKYGHRMDLPEELSGDAFIREQEKTTDAMASLSCCDKPGSHPVPMHRLLPSDPLLQILLGTLSHFFAHSVELNLALTGVITSLAVCPYRSLEGWLLFKSTDGKQSSISGDEGEAVSEEAKKPMFTLDDSDDEESLPSYLTRNNNKSRIAQVDDGAAAAPPAFTSFPPFFTMLKTLTQQVDYYRSEIDGFDEYLADRRRGLLVATELNSAIHTPGLAEHSHSHPQHQQYAQQPHYHPGGFGSTDSFMDPAGGARSLTPTMSPSSSSLAGSTSPRFVNDSNSRVTSPAPQRINTNPSSTTSASMGAPNAALKISSPRARKSSSPSSLMSTPSNMSFLVPPGMSKKPFKSNSGSPLAGHGSNSATWSTSSEDHSMSSPSTLSVASSASASIHQRTNTHQSTLSVSSSMSSATLVGSRPSAMGGMATTGAPPTGLGLAPGGPMHHPNASGSWGTFGAPPPNPMMRAMDTMMIKPLFSDGFVNDSDSEAEAGLDTSDDEEEEGEETSGPSSRDMDEDENPRADDDLTKPTTSSTKRRSSVSGAKAKVGGGAPQDKTVTLGQLLTNVVILEEVVKEVVAVAQVRRGLGVDKVRFL
ncbi:MAG: Retinoic acid induced 16-like protein-domain-containing protein [Podila humilis]|nr:MAG: Retinoic acid induced 16-like protein-domain-containing protein [Podila humilis]